MRTLTITTNSDWEAELIAAGERAEIGIETDTHQGETLNFATPGMFFSHLTERRWQLLNELIGSGAVGVRELARRLGRDVKYVHEDAASLVNLGLLEKDERGAVYCPFEHIHVDRTLEKKMVAI